MQTVSFKQAMSNVSLIKCDVCGIFLNSKDQAYQHNIGSKHYRNLKKLSLPIPPEIEALHGGNNKTKPQNSNTEAEKADNKFDNGRKNSSNEDNENQIPSVISTLGSKNNETVSSNPVNDALIKNLRGELSTKKKIEIPCEICFERFECTVCGIFTSSSGNLEDHRRGAKHRRCINIKAKLAGAGSTASKAAEEMPGRVKDMYYCSVCDISVISPMTLRVHLSSEFHKKRHSEKNNKEDIEHLHTVGSNYLSSDRPIGPADYPPNFRKNKQIATTWKEAKEQQDRKKSTRKNCNSYGFVKGSIDNSHNASQCAQSEKRKRSWKDYNYGSSAANINNSAGFYNGQTYNMIQTAINYYSENLYGQSQMSQQVQSNASSYNPYESGFWNQFNQPNNYMPNVQYPTTHLKERVELEDDYSCYFS
ncbi:DgyrCDS4101 [Dimorphilus gyrociliatus]|uniref:DgyrCDS4101 n=1 Tax=Dimorphilus gyrociliatus TaxID=2664684 RepID=A0A7I8VFX9_9ANNE|nr:DgyrCDS4101 [Dimorphilus gyrociliatus]